MTYNQSGFDLDEKRGHDKYAYVRFSKIGWVKIRYTRPIPDRATIKEVTFKKERTGEWFVSFGLKTDDSDLSERPDVDSLDASNASCLARRKGQTTTRSNAERLPKSSGGIQRKVLDYQYKITTWLVKEYDAVFVEDLNVAGMIQGDENARNKQDAAWRQFITLLEYKGNLYGTHVKQVEAPGTTKECASCGVETAKPIWVREHSCPSCGFETDRDANAAMNVLQRGFSELGLGWPEDTPVETVTATDTDDIHEVSASHVVETGSLSL